jgi:hypothetical protein
VTSGGDSLRLFFKGKVTKDLGKSLCFVSVCLMGGEGGDLCFVLRKFDSF